MPEKRRRNRFEEHINSDAFDLSQLENFAPMLAEEERRLLNYLGQLPQPLDHDLWDTHLDEQQRLLCAYLTTELLETVVRTQHDDLVGHLNDEELFQLVLLPVVMGMLVEENLHERKPVTAPPPAPEPSVEPLRVRVQRWWQRFRTSLDVLLQRLSQR